MDSVILLCVILSLCLNGFTILWAGNRLDTISQKISIETERLNALQPEEFDSEGLISEMKNSIENIVSETLENLEPPRAIDHVFGAVAQLIQMKAMGAMNALPEGVMNMAESVMGSNEDV